MRPATGVTAPTRPTTRSAPEKQARHNGLVSLDPDVRRDLEWVRDDYARLVATTKPADLAAATRGTRWTNAELLFHMWFGQHIARVFIPVFGGFSRFPPGAAKAWSRLLTAATPFYNWINYAGSVAGAHTAGLERAQRWMTADTDWIIAWAERATHHQLAAGMSVPTSWDPYFTAWMSRADILTWAPKHYRHHRDQLTVE